MSYSLPKTQPMQPIYLDDDGTPRFKNNAMIRKLLDEKFFSLEDVAAIWENVPVEDVEQFWQLLGYSISGYSDLSFVRTETIAEADAKAKALIEESKHDRVCAEITIEFKVTDE
jgi:hypothetical protein